MQFPCFNTQAIRTQKFSHLKICQFCGRLWNMNSHRKRIWGEPPLLPYGSPLHCSALHSACRPLAAVQIHTILSQPSPATADCFPGPASVEHYLIFWYQLTGIGWGKEFLLQPQLRLLLWWLPSTYIACKWRWWVDCSYVCDVLRGGKCGSPNFPIWPNKVVRLQLFSPETLFFLRSCARTPQPLQMHRVSDGGGSGGRQQHPRAVIRADIIPQQQPWLYLFSLCALNPCVVLWVGVPLGVDQPTS